MIHSCGLWRVRYGVKVIYDSTGWCCISASSDFYQIGAPNFKILCGR